MEAVIKKDPSTTLVCAGPPEDSDMLQKSEKSGPGKMWELRDEKWSKQRAVLVLEEGEGGEARPEGWAASQGQEVLVSRGFCWFFKNLTPASKTDKSL